MGIWKYCSILLVLLSLFFLAGCTTPQADAPADNVQTEVLTLNGERVFTIGAVAPLTGEGAAYGLPVQRVTNYAVEKLNEEWAQKGQRLEVIWEDGKCNGKDALSAAQTLVNVHDVDIIYGGTCSGETLGFAAFTEQNEVLVFSPLSSSPDITQAGDFVFRNYPSDAAQVATLAPFIVGRGHTKVAILSENTDYAQVLREHYLKFFAENNVEVVADEIAAPNTKDVRTEVSKIKAAEPDAIITLPQTIPTGGIFAKQLFEANVEAEFFGNDVAALEEGINEFRAEYEGYYMPVNIFEKENDPVFLAMQETTDCELGYYCATTYDGIFLLGEALEECGDTDTVCLRDFMYDVTEWRGPVAEEITMDENGDVAGSFIVRQIIDGTHTDIN